jgi:diaminohydroxyphosphoribosylaminopyrimidine deaminase/5-amino-6-(5-phosphoribosylamino)uracil reductase
MTSSDLDRWHMQRALELAVRGQGYVEPNPMVGCVIARGAEVIAEGWHRRYGGPHAEVEALTIAGPRAAGATLYATLEPCCHHGKTPPCTEAILAAGVSRVVVAHQDPFPPVSGGGLAALASAGITVEVGLFEEETRSLNAPYLKLVTTGRPWIIAKWAMTLDGKIATRTGDSRWISSEASRALVHQLRGRMDALVIGSRTAAIDDPLLTSRPPGARSAMRVVVDSAATLSANSQLLRTARETPLLVAVGPQASAEQCRTIAAAGGEVFACAGVTHAERLHALLAEFGRRRMTNVLVEGGAGLLGAFFDESLIDEFHVFVAPKLLGGADAPGPIKGRGRELLAAAVMLGQPKVQVLGEDAYLHARVAPSIVRAPAGP